MSLNKKFCDYGIPTFRRKKVMSIKTSFVFVSLIILTKKVSCRQINDIKSNKNKKNRLA
jgi:hypothetical protein